MGFAIKVYEAFKDDEVKAKVLAEFIEKVEEAINNNHVATRQDLHVQELKLIKEIELTRREIKEVELKLTKEIQQTKVSLLKWLIGLLLTQTLTIIGVIIGLFQVFK